jgi:hypothetical protein
MEAVIMGIIVVVLGYVVGYFTKPFFSVDLPDVCKSWNDKYMLEVNLFLIGFIAHVGFELAGLNSWYCKHGHACMDI